MSCQAYFHILFIILGLWQGLQVPSFGPFFTLTTIQYTNNKEAFNLEWTSGEWCGSWKAIPGLISTNERERLLVNRPLQETVNPKIILKIMKIQIIN